MDLSLASKDGNLDDTIRTMGAGDVIEGDAFCCCHSGLCNQWCGDNNIMGIRIQSNTGYVREVPNSRPLVPRRATSVLAAYDAGETQRATV